MLCRWIDPSQILSVAAQWVVCSSTNSKRYLWGMMPRTTDPHPNSYGTKIHDGIKKWDKYKTLPLHTSTHRTSPVDSSQLLICWDTFSLQNVVATTPSSLLCHLRPYHLCSRRTNLALHHTSDLHAGKRWKGVRKSDHQKPPQRMHSAVLRLKRLECDGSIRLFLQQQKSRAAILGFLLSESGGMCSWATRTEGHLA